MTTPGAMELPSFWRRCGIMAAGVRDGGLEPCAGSGRVRWRSFRRGGVYQSDAGSSGLSRDRWKTTRPPRRSSLPCWMRMRSRCQCRGPWSRANGRRVQGADGAFWIRATGGLSRPRHCHDEPGLAVHLADARRQRRGGAGHDRPAQHRQRPDRRGAAGGSVPAFGASDRGGFAGCPGRPGAIAGGAVRASRSRCWWITPIRMTRCEKVLTALRPLTRGKLRVLFGCGGDRDRTKRPLMARTAERTGRRRLCHQRQSADGGCRRDHRGDCRRDFRRTGRKPVIVEPDRRAAIGEVLEDAEAAMWC